MLKIVGIFSVLLLIGCANDFQNHYRAAPGSEILLTNRSVPPGGNVVVERAEIPPDRKLNALIDAYQSRGYALIGSSLFNSSGSVHESNALQHAKKVGADLVLIFNPGYTGSVTKNVPIVTPTSTTSYTTSNATAYGRGGSATAYGRSTTITHGEETTYIPVTEHRSDNGALFFVRQKIKFGASYRNLNASERQVLQSNMGVVVVNIVNRSPAFISDVLVGDIILEINGEKVVDADDFSVRVKGLQGRNSFLLFRSGERLIKNIDF